MSDAVTPKNLATPSDLAAGLRARLPGWHQIDWVDSIDSTNAQMIASFQSQQDPASWPCLLGSDHQTQGRGRAGRPWVDKPGQTLMFSCGFAPQMPARHLAGLAPALGIAACDALRRLAAESGQRLQMKWPNDLMIDEGKLAGILVESRIRGNQVFIVAGIGLNLANGAELRSRLNREVTDWAQLKSPQNARIDITAAIAQSWFDCMDNYNPDRLRDLIERFQSFDYLAGKSVNAVQDDQILMSGTACGMGSDASLQIRLSDGSLRSISVGDISVRAQT